MSVTKELREKLSTDFARAEGDTGSPEIQCALFTWHIKNLTEHLKNNNKKDHQARRGLIAFVTKRRRLLKYLNRKDSVRCKDLMKKLELKKI